MGRPCLPLGRVLGALVMSVLTTLAQAAAVQPTHEAELDAIFSQSSFGLNPIDIRFNPAQTLVNPDWLLNETEQAAWSSSPGVGIDVLTRASGLANSLTIPVFYMDGYVSHGVSNTSVLGLAWVGDNGLTLNAAVQADIVERPEAHLPCPADLSGIVGCYVLEPGVTAADVANHRLYAASVLAHELAHNLGLQHTNELSLMSGSSSDASFSTYLSTAQVQTLLTSRFVQTDADGHRFVSITPFAVLAAVPEPATVWLMLTGTLVLGGQVRRQRKAFKKLDC